jgi:hypothetical protein
MTEHDPHIIQVVRQKKREGVRDAEIAMSLGMTNLFATASISAGVVETGRWNRNICAGPIRKMVRKFVGPV